MSRNVSIVRRLITAVLVMLIIVIPGQSALAADKFENSNFYLSLKKQVANLALDSGASCEYDPDTETITIYMYVSPEMENQLRLQAETDVVKGTFEMMESLSTDIVDQCEKEGYADLETWSFSQHVSIGYPNSVAQSLMDLYLWASLT